jgi:hypothetical protein
MNDNRALFIEEAITGAVKGLLAGRVNEILADAEFLVPPVEFSGYPGGSILAPVVVLSTCERTEKERIIRLDAYALTITFALPENPDGELSCYAYASAVDRVLAEDPSLGGVVDRVILTDKKYKPPKSPGCGEDWELVLSLRLTVEGMSNAG